MSNQSTHQPDRQARSPWSLYNEKQAVVVGPPAAAIEATIRVPGSKSMTSRALLMAALAEGESELGGVLRSDDSYWCIEALRRLGVEVAQGGERAVVSGCGGKWPNRAGAIFLGASGILARFLPAVLAVSAGEWELAGSRRLSERPLAPLLAALTELGARFDYGQEERRLPFTLRANGLAGGRLELPGSVSSQFISGLLLAAPYAASPVTIGVAGEVVQRDYVGITLAMMASFGATPEVSPDGRTIVVPVGAYRAQSLRLEPDVSTCGYFWALAALTAGRVRIEGLDARRTSQPDAEVLQALQRMGCEVACGADFAEVRGASRLRGGFTLSMRRWSDQTLTMAALAVFADGPITLTGAAHIREHECDRIAAMCAELRKLGIRVDEREDGMTVYPGQPQPAPLDSHDDHRMAMALSLIGSRVPGITIADPGCVSKTCPDYWDRLAALGVDVRWID
ncbi:3-phosphoshikimate 1-carboxyvinyltransferase [Paenibacillus cymbidii]|uniref:3-phosphoshikimate 1-carboxyvinyltransferase n=1 Tax=Paenibacillus cymbidii TaxID=1639034 RepID=UPI0010804815|nr:3-phosphoshikimate 1-carboxyvinyltransferase [Paenibacillus cymbidii]